MRLELIADLGEKNNRVDNCNTISICILPLNKKNNLTRHARPVVVYDRDEFHKNNILIRTGIIPNQPCSFSAKAFI